MASSNGAMMGDFFRKLQGLMDDYGVEKLSKSKASVTPVVLKFKHNNKDLYEVSYDTNRGGKKTLAYKKVEISKKKEVK